VLKAPPPDARHQKLSRLWKIKEPVSAADFSNDPLHTPLPYVMHNLMHFDWFDVNLG
jgi:hypothetical protein